MGKIWRDVGPSMSSVSVHVWGFKRTSKIFFPLLAHLMVLLKRVSKKWPQSEKPWHSLSLVSLELFPRLGRVLQWTLPICCVQPCEPHLKLDLRLTMESGSLCLPLVLKPYWPLCPGGTSSPLPAYGCSRACVSLIFSSSETAARFARWLLRVEKSSLCSFLVPF